MINIFFTETENILKYIDMLNLTNLPKYGKKKIRAPQKQSGEAKNKCVWRYDLKNWFFFRDHSMEGIENR